MSQEVTKNMVETNVFENVSGIIDALEESDERIHDFLDPDDWRGALLDYLDNPNPALSRADIELLAEATDQGYEDGIVVEDVIWAIKETEGVDWRELCEEMEILPDQSPVFECWLVSKDLGRRLKNHGERVLLDWHNLTIWGRRVTGQFIWMDTVIREIAAGAKP